MDTRPTRLRCLLRAEPRTSQPQLDSTLTTRITRTREYRPVECPVKPDPSLKSARNRIAAGVQCMRRMGFSQVPQGLKHPAWLAGVAHAWAPCWRCEGPRVLGARFATFRALPAEQTKTPGHC